MGNLAQQLYNTVDSIVVGQYIGDTALAAVGTAGPILNLLLVLFMGIATGASILIRPVFRRARSGDPEPGGRRVHSADGHQRSFHDLCGLFPVPMADVAGIAAPRRAGRGRHLPADHLIGILGGAAYNILAGVLRGLGDSLMPLISLLVASLLNIVLDILFVSQFRMGVAGVAWATIIAQAVSGVMCLVRLCRMRRVVDVNRQTLRPDWSIIRRLCSLGVPAGITQAIFSLSAIIVQSLTNSMGTSVIAASVAVMRVDGFAMMPNFTFGTAATTYVGQNIGARRADRIHQGTKDLMLLALSVAAVLVLCILLFGHNLIGLFTTTEDVLAIGQRGLHWLAVGYLCFAVSQVLQGEMRGAGETMIPMWISIISTVILRMPLAYLLAYLTRSDVWPNGNPDMLYASLLLSWVSSMLMTIVAYRAGWWRRKLPDDLKETL